MSTTVRASAFVLALALSSSMMFSQTPDSAASATAPASSDDTTMRLGAGDLVNVSVYGVPELDTKTRVGPNGMLSLPLLNEVAVEGLTANQAERKLEGLLVKGNFLKAPHVTISVAEFTSQGISVMGEVEHPGIYPLLGKRRLFDLISQAGGLSAKAGKIVTLTHRATPDQAIMVEISDDPARSVASNVEVLPGDTVVVSRAGIVYVVGEVQKPGGFMMENNGSLTVLQAIALAQGATKLARLDKAKLIRKTSAGPQELSIDLKGILTAKKPDLPLLAEDIIFLPSSPGKNAARRTLEAVVQSATGLAIYGPIR
jgi:polysaccharide export outer membrane protein